MDYTTCVYSSRQQLWCSLISQFGINIMALSYTIQRHFRWAWWLVCANYFCANWNNFSFLQGWVSFFVIILYNDNFLYTNWKDLQGYHLKYTVFNLEEKLKYLKGHISNMVKTNLLFLIFPQITHRFQLQAKILHVFLVHKFILFFFMNVFVFNLIRKQVLNQN